MKLPVWYPSEEVDAQMAHVGWGIAFVLLVHVWGGGLLLGLLVVLAWATLKEFVFDIVIEQDSWASSAVDFAFYCVGAAMGMIGVLL